MAENETNQQENHGHRNTACSPPAEFAANAAISGMDAYNKLCAKPPATTKVSGPAWRART
jgi:acetyl-CoA synthetase